MTRRQRSVSSPARNTGLPATLHAYVRVKGTRTLRTALLLALTLTAALALTAASALAAAPEAPSMTVEPVFATVAFFNGTLSPKGGVPAEGTYEFLYRETKAKTGCKGGSATAPGLALGGSPEVLNPEQVSALKPGTEYTACLKVENESKVAESPAVTFTTATPPEVPVTLAAKAVSAESVTLAGELNPKAKAAVPVEYDFLYQLSESECAAGTAAPEALVKAAGKPKEVVSLALTGLQPDATYTYCVLAFNSAGEQASGLPVSFKTLAAKPKVVAATASGGSSTTMGLEAQVNPNNQEATVLVEYATAGSTGPGGKLEGTILKTPETALPASYGAAAATFPTLEGLNPGAQYFYRVAATNATGTTLGEVSSFATVPTPVTDPPTPLGAATATLAGHFTLNGVATQYSFTYRQGGECTGRGAVTTPSTEAGTGATSASAAAPVTELLPRSEYTACLILTSAFGSQQGPPGLVHDPRRAARGHQHVLERSDRHQR